MEIIINVLEVIGGLIGILAIVIVIWDHFKDDRRLTREVQEFYESIEHFIEYYLKKGQTQGTNGKSDVFITTLSEFEYYKNVVKTRFADFSKYLGLTMGKSQDRRYEKLDAYMTKSRYLLIEDGHLLIRDPGYYQSHGMIEIHAIGSDSNLRKKEAHYINSFFLDLRNHWKAMYSKKLFRLKLKQKIDFNLLVTEKD